MLFPDTESVPIQDPLLPGLGVVLAPEEFAKRLRRSLNRSDLETPRVTYVKYVPGTKCLVGYRLQVDGKGLQIHAISYAETARHRVLKASGRPGISGPLFPGRFVFADCATVVTLFPNDRKLPGLPILADPESRGRLLRDLAPDRPDLWDGDLECLAYKPERRFVGRLRTRQGNGAVLRAYDTVGYTAAETNTRLLTSSATLRLAPRIATSAPSSSSGYRVSCSAI